MGMGAGDPADTGRTYLCIDLKSFYASVECAELGLDPFRDNLVVADTSRGMGTICLAVTPAMKALGVRNRCRLFQIPRNITYRAVRPRMRLYMETSARIYGIYLRYVAPEDVHVYSVDECFVDATPYLRLYGTDGRGMARMLMGAVRDETGICATAGVGTNLFLAKVALDVTAKHEEDHLGYLDGARFRERVWHHRPITDIWQVGPGIAERLGRMGIRDLAGVAALAERDPQALYREFGVNARHLIDHARGVEPCTIDDIRSFEPERTSVSNGQVLAHPVPFGQARVIMREMVEESARGLGRRASAGGHVSLWVGYATDAPVRDAREARRVPHASASRRLPAHTSSRAELLRRFDELFSEVVDPGAGVKRVCVGLGDLVDEGRRELTLFDDVEAERAERRLAEACLAVRGRYGAAALMRGTSLRPGATGRERAELIGGHHA